MADDPVTLYTLNTHDDGEMWWAEVDELPGCFASGRDYYELLDAAAEAIEQYLGADCPHPYGIRGGRLDLASP
jgi:predicted RNase H-like HicB family nuclease